MVKQVKWNNPGSRKAKQYKRGVANFVWGRTQKGRQQNHHFEELEIVHEKQQAGRVLNFNLAGQTRTDFHF